MACHQKKVPSLDLTDQLGYSGQVKWLRKHFLISPLTGNVPLSRAVCLFAPVEQSSDINEGHGSTG